MIQAMAPVPLRSPWHYLYVPGLLTQCHSVTVSRFNGVGSKDESPVANDAAPHHVYRSLQILKFIPQTGHLPA